MYDSIKSWLKQDLTVYPKGVIGGDGDETPMAPFSCKCYLVHKQKAIRKADGTIIVGTSIIYLVASIDIKEEDTVEIHGKKQKVLAINTYSSTNGTAAVKEVIL